MKRCDCRIANGFFDVGIVETDVTSFGDVRFRAA